MIYFPVLYHVDPSFCASKFVLEITDQIRSLPIPSAMLKVDTDGFDHCQLFNIGEGKEVIVCVKC